jgi:hypothetical protein
VRHSLMLPAPVGLLPGAYQVRVGVYETATGAVWSSSGGDSTASVSSLERTGYDMVERPASDPVCTFGGRIDLLTANLRTEPVQAGRDIQLELLWRARQPISHDWTVFAQLLGDDDTVIAHQEAMPAQGRSRTSTWLTGHVVRERRVLHVPADAPAGTYRLIVGLYRTEDGSRLAPDHVWPWLTHDYLTLGEIVVYPRTPQLEMPVQPAHLSGVTLANGIELAGYSLELADARPGGRIRVNLIWHVTGPINDDYSVFCHLLDGAGRRWGQADGTPAGGTLPTLTWMAGEYILDEHEIPLQADAPAGEYRLRVGLYAPASGIVAGEPAELGPFSVGL